MEAELNEVEEQRRVKASDEELQRQKRIADIRAKADARMEKNEQLRKAELDYRKLIQNKPLYMKIEESYRHDRILPEIKRRKEHLARKHQGFRPINREEFEEHARHIEEIKLKLEARRAKFRSERKLDDQVAATQRHLSTSFTYAVIQHDSEARNAHENEKQERKRLAVKQRQYAAIIKEMYSPTIDSLKQKEMLLIQERLTNPVKSLVKRSQSTVPHRLKSGSHVNLSFGIPSSSSPNRSRPKFEKNRMVPAKKTKLEPKTVDYLGERRKFRENYAHSEASFRVDNWPELEALETETDSKQLKRKASRFEKEAKRQELLLSSMSPADINGLNAVDKVNDMLIGSIKAKLTLLKQAVN